MRDKYYGDNRDLVKWAVLSEIATSYQVQRILQIAYWQPTEYPPVSIDGKDHAIQHSVLAHFRDICQVSSMSARFQISVFDEPFLDREDYTGKVLAFINAHQSQKSIVFLDPDVGLEPRAPTSGHVLRSEAKSIWDVIKPGDVFAFYQHQTNRAGLPWVEQKRVELARAICLTKDLMRVAMALEIANDIVIFYAIKGE